LHQLIKQHSFSTLENEVPVLHHIFKVESVIRNFDKVSDSSNNTEYIVQSKGSTKHP